MRTHGRPLRSDNPAATGASLPERLVALGTQLLELAGELSQMPDAARLAADGATLGRLAEDAIDDRRRRTRHLPLRVLGEPGWDILLGLYAAAGRGDAVSVSDACEASGAPASTALRWLHHLEAEGLVERRHDATDARRRLVRLTGLGIERMSAYFAESRAGLVRQAAA